MTFNFLKITEEITKKMNGIFRSFYIESLKIDTKKPIPVATALVVNTWEDMNKKTEFKFEILGETMLECIECKAVK